MEETGSSPLYFHWIGLVIYSFRLILIRTIWHDDSSYAHFTDKEASLQEVSLNKVTQPASTVAKHKFTFSWLKSILLFTPKKTSEAHHWLQGELLGWSNWFRLLINLFNEHLEPWAGYKRYKGRQIPGPDLQKSARSHRWTFWYTVDDLRRKEGTSTVLWSWDPFLGSWDLSDI